MRFKQFLLEGRDFDANPIWEIDDGFVFLRPGQYSEQTQIDAIKHHPFSLAALLGSDLNLSDTVLLTGLQEHPEEFLKSMHHIGRLYKPLSHEVVNAILSHPVTLSVQSNWSFGGDYLFPRIVKSQYYNNELLQNKWLRYWNKHKGKS